MSSIKCAECGLVNFATASECKRCHVKFHHPEPFSETSPADEPASDAASPDTTDMLTAPAPVMEPALEPEPHATESPQWSPAPLPEYFDLEPQGLSPAMILFAVYLIFTIVVLGFQLNQLSEVSTGRAWGLMIDPKGKLYVPNFEALFYVSWILHILGMFASFILLIPLLIKMRAFLILVRVYLLLGFVYFAVEITTGFSLRASLMEKLPVNSGAEPALDRLYWGSILRIIGFLVTFIWFRYFTTSDRVKRTFIN